jgi:hypothetical protein
VRPFAKSSVAYFTPPNPMHTLESDLLRTANLRGWRERIACQATDGKEYSCIRVRNSRLGRHAYPSAVAFGCSGSDRLTFKDRPFSGQQHGLRGIRQRGLTYQSGSDLRTA